METEALLEGFDLGPHLRPAAGSAQDRNRGIVDHAAPACSPEILEGIRQKYLHVKPLKARIELHVEHSRIAQYQARALNCHLAAADFERVGRGIMLHLLDRKS